jgi:hypothetical protein
VPPQKKRDFDHFMLLGNETFAGGGVKSGDIMKNKIMIEPNKAAKRRVHLAYARAFARLDDALARNTDDEGPTDRQRINAIRRRLWGTLPEDRPR